MRNWKKRAIEMSMQAIIVAVISLVVLVIVILVFKTQISKTTARYFGIGEQAAAEANVTNKCESLFGDRRCMPDPCAPVPVPGVTPEKFMYYAKIPGRWADCDAKQMVCCERVS